MKKFKDKAGYVSVETVIVAGLIITIGVFALTNLTLAGREVVADGSDRVFLASLVEDPGVGEPIL